MTKSDFERQVEALVDTVKNFEDADGTEVIESTAQRLEGVHYAPPIVVPVPTFLRLTKDSLIDEINGLLALPDDQACALAPDEPGKCQDLRLQFISGLIYYYRKLIKLRAGDPEEWDEIDEIYIHD